MLTKIKHWILLKYFRLNRQTAALLFVTGAIQGLLDKGMITGPDLISENGKRVLESLKKNNYYPTDEEFNEARSKMIVNETQD